VPSTPLAPMVGNRRALVAVLMAVSLATLDSSITNTALPNIAAALQARPAASIWVVIAYQLAVVAALLPFAALADRLGTRRVHLGGMAFFVVASLASALAWSLPSLVAARALQGLGAAAMMSVNIALVRQIYPPQQLGRGVGLNALVVGVSFAIGPTVASTLLAWLPWPWLYALNLPLGLLAFAVGYVSLPRTAPRGQPSMPRPRFSPR
jgi:MFS transporter, DHA2 family, multidrug resistance protein